jgi:hypothetical protein
VEPPGRTEPDEAGPDRATYQAGPAPVEPAAAQSSPNVPCDVRSEFARWQVTGQLEQEKGRAGVSNEGRLPGEEGGRR